MSEDIVFHCKNGHSLGIVQKDAAGVSRLLLYRNAIDLEISDPIQVEIIATIDSASNITCDICGEKRTWSPNQAAYENMMKHFITKVAPVRFLDSIK